MAEYNAKQGPTRVARVILEKCAVKTKPVDVFGIARKLGIEVRTDIRMPDKEVSGLIKRRGKSGKPIIVLNPDQNINRQRFTLAHELGHFLLHVLDPLHVDRDYVYFRDNVASLAIDLKEIQANQFAAELLMPKTFLFDDLKNEKMISDLNENEKLVEKLAEAYEVSKQAMTIRIGALFF